MVGGTPRAAEVRRRAVLAGLGVVIVVGLLAGLAVFAAPLARSRVGTAQSGPDPSAIVDGFEQARNQRDVEAILTFFSDDATLTDRTGHVYQGKNDIRAYFQQLNARARGVTLGVVNRRVVGPEVTWTERPPVQNAVGFEIGVSATIRDGKIQSLIYAAPTAVGRQDPTADARSASSSFPAPIGLLSVLLTACGAVFLLSARTGRPVAGWESQLRGRLVSELATWRADQRGPLG